MLTGFGKELRKLRVDKGETLSKMSKKLNISVSYLSAIENGVREVPVDFIDRLCCEYHLNDEKRKVFQLAAADSANKIAIPLDSALIEQRQLAFMLSRKLKDLSSDDCDKIMKILGGEISEQ